MKKLLLLILSLTSFAIFSANASPYPEHSDDVFVNGYAKRDGTHVDPYWRSAPNSHNNGY